MQMIVIALLKRQGVELYLRWWRVARPAFNLIVYGLSPYFDMDRYEKEVFYGFDSGKGLDGAS